jgi:hypothetical protein
MCFTICLFITGSPDLGGHRSPKNGSLLSNPGSPEGPKSQIRSHRVTLASKYRHCTTELLTGEATSASYDLNQPLRQSPPAWSPDCQAKQTMRRKTELVHAIEVYICKLVARLSTCEYTPDVFPSLHQHCLVVQPSGILPSGAGQILVLSCTLSFGGGGRRQKLLDLGLEYNQSVPTELKGSTKLLSASF